MPSENPLASLDPDWPIGRSVVEPLTLGDSTDPGTTPRQCAEEVSADVGLGPVLLDRRPDEVSGWQRQRVVLARH
jgi:ABC-type dipeptide/oligopeptide/nickel transport system ATPase subunit